MELLIIALTGSVMGFVTSFFGIGGGSILVPILYLAYPEMEPQTAIPISLGSIFVITFLNTIRFYKHHLLTNRKIIFKFMVSCTLAGLAGTKILYTIDPDLTKKILGFAILVSALKMMLLRSHNSSSEEMISDPKFIFLTGFSGSLLSSITGLGGGIIFTPMLINIVQLPFKFISAYANLAMCVATFMGTLPHFFMDGDQGHNFAFKLINNFYIGNVNLLLILLIVSASMLTAPIGIKLNNSVSPDKKRLMLFFILLGFSLKIILN